MFARKGVKRSFTPNSWGAGSGEPEAHRYVLRHRRGDRMCRANVHHCYVLRRGRNSIRSAPTRDFMLNSLTQWHRLPSSKELPPAFEFTKFALAPAMNSED